MAQYSEMEPMRWKTVETMRRVYKKMHPERCVYLWWSVKGVLLSVASGEGRRGEVSTSTAAV